MKMFKDFKNWLLKKLLENNDEYIKKTHAIKVVHVWFDFYNGLTQENEYANINKKRLNDLLSDIERFKSE